LIFDRRELARPGTINFICPARQTETGSGRLGITSFGTRFADPKEPAPDEAPIVMAEQTAADD
jgi:hypothetical protein